MSRCGRNSLSRRLCSVMAMTSQGPGGPSESTGRPGTRRLPVRLLRGFDRELAQLRGRPVTSTLPGCRSLFRSPSGPPFLRRGKSSFQMQFFLFDLEHSVGPDLPEQTRVWHAAPQTASHGRHHVAPSSNLGSGRACPPLFPVRRKVSVSPKPSCWARAVLRPAGPGGACPPRKARADRRASRLCVPQPGCCCRPHAGCSGRGRPSGCGATAGGTCRC